MAFVGGFLGGGVELIPEGYGKLLLQWITPDRLNMGGAVFTLSRTDVESEAINIAAKSDGRAETLLEVGEYTISVQHEGKYIGDGPQPLIVESTQGYLALFGVSQSEGSLVIEDYYPGATITVTDLEGATIYSGEMTPRAISTGMGTCHYKVVQGGVTAEGDVTTVGKTRFPIDVSTKVTWSEKIKSFVGEGKIQFEGGECPADLDCIRIINGVAKKIVTFVSTAEWAEGELIKTSRSVTADGTDITLTAVITDPYVIRTSGSYTFPLLNKTYRVTAVGGGHGGGGGTGGSGGAGSYASSNVSVESDPKSIHITVGKGGSGGPSSTTSLSTNGGGGNSTSVSGSVSVTANGASNSSPYGASGSLAGIKITGGDPEESSNIASYPEWEDHFGSSTSKGGKYGGQYRNGSYVRYYSGTGGYGTMDLGNGGGRGGGYEDYEDGETVYRAYSGGDGRNGGVLVVMNL